MTQQTCKHDKFMGGVCVKCDYVAFSNLPMTQQKLLRKKVAVKIYENAFDNWDDAFNLADAILSLFEQFIKEKKPKEEDSVYYNDALESYESNLIEGLGLKEWKC